MKNLIAILIVAMALMSCQKEFPSAPDYSVKNQLTVSENWKHEIPEGEKVVWVGVVDNNIIYLTNNEAQTKLSTYTFSKSGELLNTKNFAEEGIAEDVFAYRDIKQNGDWIRIKRGYGFFLLNFVEGTHYSTFNSTQRIEGVKFDYFLGKENYCYYQTIDAENNTLAIQWDLTLDQTLVLDTLAKNTIGVYPILQLIDENDVNGTFSYDVNLVYVKQDLETSTGTIAYSILGLLDDDFRGKELWTSDFIFREKSDNTLQSGTIKDGKAYLSMEQQIICIDVIMRELLWKKDLDNWQRSGFAFSNDNVFCTLETTIIAMDKANGNTEWLKDVGYGAYHLSAENESLSTVGFRKTDDTFLGSRSNHLTIYQSTTGQERYLNPDPINVGSEVLDEGFEGLSKAIATAGNNLFFADDTYFISVSVN
jgi:hypothetical protein